MRRLFAVVRSHGPAWQRDRDLRLQDGWSDHARFMNALAAEGFIVVGGPLAGSEDTLLIVAAQNEEEIRHRFAADPWGKDMLIISQLALWQVLLGEGRLAGGERN